jgi:hypothetical protein
MSRKDIKVGVLIGRGPPPGYLWTVFILDIAFEESQKILTAEQYDYIADRIRDLASEEDPGHSDLCSVDAVEEFFELREKYGPLKKTCVRVFFHLDNSNGTKAIVVLGVMKKEAEGKTPPGDRIRMRRRMRLYDSGNLKG